MILLAILGVPLLGAAAMLGIGNHRRIVATLASLVAVTTAGLAVYAWTSGQNQWVSLRDLSTFGLPIGELDAPLRIGASTSGWAVAAIVGVVAAAVQLYTVWYLDDDDRYTPFAATVSLFTAAMLLVVLSRDAVLTVVGWELMGWCSYLLIGHWSRVQAARRASQKAYLVTRGADVGFVLGFGLLAAGAKSSDLAAIVTKWTPPTECLDTRLAAGFTPGQAAELCNAPNASVRTVALLLIVIGILGKSAQFPFQDWLPDAMEGPTPASALIHAATMVAAGTVVLAAIFPVFTGTPGARWLLGVLVSISIVGAGLLAFAQDDLKRLLAWSTVSQVGIMLGALAAAPPAAGPDSGLFQMWSHAIIKAMLFLALGWAAVLVGGTSAVKLRGSSSAVPMLRAAFLVGFLALAGVPFIVGGLSKEAILDVAYEGAIKVGGPSLIVLVAVLLGTALTAAYSTRAYLIMTAHVREKADPPQVPAYVGAIIGFLLLLTVFGGFIITTGTFDVPSSSTVWLIISVLVIAVGVAVALVGGLDRDPAMVLAARFVPAASVGWHADGAYQRLVVAPVLALARFARRTDREVFEAPVEVISVATRTAGRAIGRVHRAERPSVSVTITLLGILAIGVVGVIAWL